MAWSRAGPCLGACLLTRVVGVSLGALVSTVGLAVSSALAVRVLAWHYVQCTTFMAGQ